jgi:hypothetical protein
MGKCMPKYQNIPNYNKIYKITTKLPQNIQNYQKYTKLPKIYPMVIHKIRQTAFKIPNDR